MDKRIDRMMEYCHIPDLGGKKVLDVGAGPGWWSFFIEGMGATVTAVDIDKHWIKKFMENKPEGCEINQLECSVYELGEKFEPQSFDVVVSFALLHHVTNPMEAVKNICGAAKDKVLIECPVGVNTQFGEHKRWGKEEQHAWWWVPSIPALLEMISDFGFICTYLKLNETHDRGYFECSRL